MINKVISKITYRQRRLPPLIMLLLPLLACALFAGNEMKGLRLMTKGENLLKERKYEKSIEVFTRAIALIDSADNKKESRKPEQLARLYKLRGTAYSGLENYDNSLEDFNKSIEFLSGGKERAYLERGNLYLHKKDYARALADFEKVIPEDDDYRPMLGMAIVHFETQNYKLAGEYLLAAFDGLEKSRKKSYYDQMDLVKAYEYSIKIAEQKGDTKAAESQRKKLNGLLNKHN